MAYSIERKQEACCYFEDNIDLNLSSYVDDISIYDIPIYDQRINYTYIPQDICIYKDELSELLELYEPATEEYCPSQPTTIIKNKKKPSVWKRFIFLLRNNKTKDKSIN